MEREREREGQRRVERSTNKEQGLDVISDDEGGERGKKKEEKVGGKSGEKQRGLTSGRRGSFLSLTIEA